ncbi:MAG: RagB/SusD family nutrient uptake outer membrane protein [Gemmatimonadota bacterium]|nr:RagB/SusD family nutrient uptake outer membrane protein [Gemmatimonadota bacterium]
MITKRFTRGVAGLAVLASLAACGDLLNVSDPQRYTNDDLDASLSAVANGVEGAVHQELDQFVVYQALLADEYQHTGTWQGYDEVDHGIFQYGTSAMDGTFNNLLRARWFALDSEERLKRVLGDQAAESSSYTAQVRFSGALADLYLGMAFCEAPADPAGPAVSDSEILQQAVDEFTTTIATAQAAGNAAIAMAATAGRARANLLLGNYAAAAADASTVPDTFSYSARFNNSNANWVVTVTTATFNEAAGMMEKWWSSVDSTGPGATSIRDPWTGELDPRMPVHWDGDRATDNVTPHYSQWKYTLETDDIPMLHADEMRLIEAEALMRTSDFVGATAIINQLRTDVGLSTVPVPGTAADMQALLLTERFAEMFMEGMRAVDLYRFGITEQVFAAMADSERPSSGRPTKFPMSNEEANDNPNIDNDLLQRCLPRTP